LGVVFNGRVKTLCGRERPQSLIIEHCLPVSRLLPCHPLTSDPTDQRRPRAPSSNARWFLGPGTRSSRAVNLPLPEPECGIWRGHGGRIRSSEERKSEQRGRFLYTVWYSEESRGGNDNTANRATNPKEAKLTKNGNYRSSLYTTNTPTYKA
jgi:hypothetical protein